MDALDLEILRRGHKALTPALGGMLAESASMCLHANRKSNPVSLNVEGLDPPNMQLHWVPVTEQMFAAYGDEQENIENGACGVAIALVNSFSKYSVVQRNRKVGGFDYYLRKDADSKQLFDARLEVSGILKDPSASKVKINARVRQKQNQTKQSDELHGMPSVVVIVEFGRPTAVVNEEARC